MSNPNFVDTISTNEVYRDLDHSRCLTDDLDAIESDIEGLETGKATANHTHAGTYAPATHEHSQYSTTDHNHTGTYAPVSHTHDYSPTSHTHTDKADLVNGVIPISQIPNEVKEVRIAANIAARNAMTGLFAGLNVYVTDATADPTVSSGGAYYLYDGTNWIKTGESESLDLVLQWANIQGRPSTLPANGGNADTVGGKHASDFATSGHSHSASQVGAAPASHTHDYAATNHNHDSSYVDKTLQFTNDNGGVKYSYGANSGKNVLDEISSMGVGFHTIYAVYGTDGNPDTTESYRFFIHKTSDTIGWVLAFGSSGSIFANYINGNTGWLGWKTIFDATPAALWNGENNGTGGYIMNASHTVTPSKPLSQCRNGWVLLWADYDPDTKTFNDYDFCTTVIPKKKPNNANWAGQPFICPVASYLKNSSPYDSETIRVKTIHVHDTKLVGHDANTADNRNDIVLRAVYEF